MKAMKNYAGHWLSPWLGHLMVSRSETARPLLTPGEVMQLPPADEIVMLAGTPPIRAKKARYFEDRRLTERVLPPPKPAAGAEPGKPDPWSSLAPRKPAAAQPATDEKTEDTANGGIRREPELPDHVAIVRETANAPAQDEFAVIDDDPEDTTRQARALRQQMRGLARQASLDPADGLQL
jgi:type IV secretion system protein VirD4